MLGSPALGVAGDLDPTFSGDGTVTTGFPGNAAASGVAVQADGKIVAAGRASDSTTGDSTFALARYRLNGGLDPGFSGDGKVTGGSPDLSISRRGPGEAWIRRASENDRERRRSRNVASSD